MFAKRCKLYANCTTYCIETVKRKHILTFRNSGNCKYSFARSNDFALICEIGDQYIYNLLERINLRSLREMVFQKFLADAADWKLVEQMLHRLAQIMQIKTA